MSDRNLQARRSSAGEAKRAALGGNPKPNLRLTLIKE
ncbi:hypothetical protein J2848_003151 [Azospirillum lipoferum]|nr:hypothetical protein [Azospirillum lipoferum]